MRRVAAALAVAACVLAPQVCAAEAAWRLERVVVVMRHGVRPPTQSADALAKYADRPWPTDVEWGAAPGDLAPHGATAIQALGRGLRAVYAADRLIPAQGAVGRSVLIWADGRDERTRETAKALAQGLAPTAPPAVGFGPDGAVDPLFDALDAGVCTLDPAEALAAVEARRPWATSETAAGLARLQAIVAPSGCVGGAGVCLQGPDDARGEAKGVKLSGPLGTAATLAEDMMLEYENGLSGAALGWGRLRRDDLDVVLGVHRRVSDLTRRTPYIARRRAAPLAELILATIAQAPTAPSDPSLIVLVGHDTNLSNLAGVFGLDWTLPGQPDVTAPGTALSFERWRDTATGALSIRLRVLYQDADAVRRLSAAPLHAQANDPPGCVRSGGYCALEPWRAQAQAELKAACPAASPPPLDRLRASVSRP